ncbi:MAG: AMP-binding protein [Opitutales bacterium]
MSDLPPSGSEALGQGQLNNLRRLLGVVLESNPFQQTKLGDAGLDESVESVEAFVSQCPLTTKDELAQDRLENPPYGTNLSYPIERYVRFHQTSGTKGEPMVWLDVAEDWDWMLGNWDQVLEAAEVSLGARCYFAFSFGPFLGFWTAFEAAAKRGCHCIPGGGLGSEQRLRAILDHEVEYLFCTPTYALRLAESAQECGMDPSSSSLKKIIVAGEPGGSAVGMRERIRKEWGGAQVFDHYGMTEVGPVAYETPGGAGGLRILLESYLVEVVRPEGEEAVADGEEGELVLTTLGRVGCPVLRYRTGDLVCPQWSENEEGRPTLDLVGGILGRVDDMIIVRGVNLYPSSVDTIVRRFGEVAEYQVLVDETASLTELSLKVEASAEAALSLEKALTEAFSLRIHVHAVESGALPRFEMKAQRWIRADSE